MLGLCSGNYVIIRRDDEIANDVNVNWYKFNAQLDEALRRLQETGTASQLRESKLDALEIQLKRLQESML